MPTEAEIRTVQLRMARLAQQQRQARRSQARNRAPKTNPKLEVIFTLAGLAGAAFLLMASPQRDNLQVRLEAVDRYKIAQQHGNFRDTCVQAGHIADAYRQVNNHTDHQQWKQIEVNDCHHAARLK